MDNRAISLKFNKVNENGFKIINEVLDNQVLLRYITYLEDNPLSSKFPDVSKYNVIYNGTNNGNVLLLPFSDSILTEKRITLFFNPYDFGNLKEITSKDVYSLDIVIPNNYWSIVKKNEWRVYTIAKEIAKSIDNKEVAGIGDTEIIGISKPYKAADSYSGVTLFIQVTNATRKAN